MNQLQSIFIRLAICLLFFTYGTVVKCYQTLRFEKGTYTVKSPQYIHINYYPFMNKKNIQYSPLIFRTLVNHLFKIKISILRIM